MQITDESAQLILDEVRHMRKLLELLAEPAIAKRDAKLRDELRRIVGASLKKQQAVFLKWTELARRRRSSRRRRRIKVI
jgi:hypothetical protein